METDPLIATELIERMTRAGWDPFNPSAECTAALDVVVVLTGLPAADRLGVRWRTTVLRLFARFAIGKDMDRYGDHLTLFAPLFVLRVDERRLITPETLPTHCARFNTWFERRYLPSVALVSAATRDEILANPSRFEPAVSAQVALDHVGLIDADADRSLMARGRAMHEEGTSRPSGIEPLDLPQLVDWFDAATRDGCLVTEFTPTGQMRVVPDKVKTALDRQYFRVEESFVGDVTLDDVIGVVEVRDSTEAVRDADAARRVREIVARRLASATPGTREFYVLTHFDALAEGTIQQRKGMSFESLSAATGEDASSLRNAYGRIREAIASEAKHSA